MAGPSHYERLQIESLLQRDTALGVLKDLQPQVDDAMQRAEINGLITYFPVLDKDG